MRKLPSILNQGSSPNCSSYAITGVANYLLAQAGKNDRVSAINLYRETTLGTGNTLGAILAKAQLHGLPLLTGERVKVNSYHRITPGALNVKNEVLKEPLAFTYQIDYDGISFSQGIKHPDYTMRWPLMSHSMIVVDYDDNAKKFWCANSWGDMWGDGGYFWIDAMRMSSPFLIDCYAFDLSF